ncbi:hypothetical protein RJ639_043580 [Escallonia herrerae]|uniref:Uncharacterized protein n=1 Tax=Escallonia herrerae TaxID=1293975 RepID=A0AA89B898_9ASTE|nr:hypothetical protein RJ639_043580 [Escallonia herrerae]
MFPNAPSASDSGDISRRRAGFYRRRNHFSDSVLALKRDACDKDHNGSRAADENMIVLRQRIREVRRVEAKDEAPPDWMEWEKGYYSSYNSDVCEAVGLLQYFLMETKPSLALEMVALAIISVMISTTVVGLSCEVKELGGFFNLVLRIRSLGKSPVAAVRTVVRVAPPIDGLRLEEVTLIMIRIVDTQDNSDAKSDGRQDRGAPDSRFTVGVVDEDFEETRELLLNHKDKVRSGCL